MSEKNINFNDHKESEEAPSTKTKIYIVLMTLMLLIYQFLKKNHMAQKNLLNTLLDTMIMTSLEHYV